MRKAVVLLSGGMDSTIALYRSQAKGFSPYALTVDYGQRSVELELLKSKNIAEYLRVPWSSMSIELPRIIDSAMFIGSKTSVEKGRSFYDKEDNTSPLLSYIPARNLILLSVATSYAEYIGAYDIFVGLYGDAPYPDATAKFISLFERTANRAIHMSKKGRKLKIHTFGNLNKLDVVLIGIDLGANLSDTFSCYAPTENYAPCGECDSCVTRRETFKLLGFDDPATLGSSNAE